MPMKQTKARKSNAVISYALSFLLSLLLVLVAMVGVVAVTVCNRSFFKTQVLQSGFCGSVLSELHENYQSYGAASGFSTEVMQGFLTEDRIQSDMFRSVEQFYDGNRENLAYPEIETLAYDAFAADLQGRGVEITADVKAGLTELAGACAADYRSHVQVPFASYLAPLLKKLQAGIVWPLVFLLVCAAFAAFFLVYLQKSGRARIRYCTYAFSASMLLCFLIPILTKLFLHMDRLNLNPLSLRVLAGEYVQSMMLAFWFFAAIYVVMVAAVTATSFVRYLQYRKAMVYKEQLAESEQAEPTAQKPDV